MRMTVAKETDITDLLFAVMVGFESTQRRQAPARFRGVHNKEYVVAIE